MRQDTKNRLWRPKEREKAIDIEAELRPNPVTGKKREEGKEEREKGKRKKKKKGNRKNEEPPGINGRLIGGGGNGTAVWAYRIITIRHGKGVAWLAYMGVRSCTYGQNGMHRAEYRQRTLYCTQQGGSVLSQL